MAPLVPNLVAHARDILSSAISIGPRDTTTTPDELAAPPMIARAAADASTATSGFVMTKLKPLAARAATAVAVRIAARDDEGTDGYKNNPHSGATNFRDVNNTGVFVVFGLIGCAFVGGGIWFFFWARNGGFYFKDNDWDDYKSTVLRRKGPNGTILSGATPSTQLGGGSVYKDYDANTEYTGGLTQVPGDAGDAGDARSVMTGITGGVSDIVGRARRKARRERKEREKEKQRDRRHRGEHGVLVDEDAEAQAQSHLRAYRSEKAARVGGINKESEGSQWDGSTNPSHSTVSGERSDLLSHREGTPTKDTPPPKKSRKTKKSSREHRSSSSKKEGGEGSSAYHQPSSYRDDVMTDAETEAERDRDTVVTGTTGTTATATTTTTTTSNANRKAGGIRKVYSTAQRNENREQERIRAEARRLAEKGRAAGGSTSGGGGGGSGATSSGNVGISIGRRFSYQRAESYNQRAGRSAAANANPTTSVIDEESDIGLMGGGGGKYLPAPESAAEEEVEVEVVDDDDGAAAGERGPKSYPYVIPGLSSSVGAPSEVAPSSSASNYQEEKRRKRATGRTSRG